nr:E3 ubiquitin-protein ligase RGLG4-like isoform X1 [Populus alba]XP_034906830.1 E3 ubiquitin-protein ligase RGLG4-like isoform X1 [Populus alba]
MGGVFSHAKSQQRGYSRGRSSGNSNIVTRGISSSSSSTSYSYHPTIMSKEPSSSLSNTARATGSDTSSQAKGGSKLEKKQSIKQKYSFIPDNFSSLEQVTTALRENGLESSNLIVGIDFTKSNEWTGKVSFNNRSLHAIGDTPNPYEKAISIIGKTMAPFDEDNLIPCFGFGDGRFSPWNSSFAPYDSSVELIFLFIYTATTHDQEVFSFHSDHSPCNGFEEVLACYKKIVPNLRLSGPTSYGPVIEAAIDIVEKSKGQYHVLLIIADGQVTRSVDTDDGEMSPQEEQTIKAIVDASSYPLSIILVGVGDGPWEDMRRFDDKIPAREFDNFQFVNFTAIMSKNATISEKETAFALAALMEIPLQYKAAVEFGIIGRSMGQAKKIVPRPPPVPYSRRPVLDREPTHVSSPALDDRTQACPICLTKGKDLAFGCGHMTCRDCGSRVSNCPICRRPITSRIRLFA